MENKDFTKSILIQPMAKYIAHYLQSSCLFLVNSTFYKIPPPQKIGHIWMYSTLGAGFDNQNLKS